jgi:hypothetical protein
MNSSRPRLALALGLSALAAVSATLVGGGAQAVTTPQCTNADLHATYRHADDAAGHSFGRIVLRNVSDHACHTRGFGGLSYVGDGNGTQIGAAADRDHSTPVRTRTLRPGDRVRSLVDETRAGNFGRHRCRPAAVDGFRVYVPDASVSQFVPHATTGCRNDAVHLISHRAYR